MISRSDKMPEYLQEVAEFLGKAQEEGTVKTASVETKQSFDEKYADLLKEAVYHGWGMYETAEGHIWHIEKDANGEDILVRDDKLSDINDVVRDLMNKDGEIDAE